MASRVPLSVAGLGAPQGEPYARRQGFGETTDGDARGKRFGTELETRTGLRHGQHLSSDRGGPGLLLPRLAIQSRADPSRFSLVQRSDRSNWHAFANAQPRGHE